jgi:hypothetical protein
VVIDRDGTISAELGSESSTRQAAATILEQYGRVGRAGASHQWREGDVVVRR